MALEADFDRLPRQRGLHRRTATLPRVRETALPDRHEHHHRHV